MIRSRTIPLTAIALSERRSRRESVAAFALYLAWSIMLLIFEGTHWQELSFDWREHRPLDLHVVHEVVAICVISHGLDPFLTDILWAPLGINLAWVTSIPLPTLVMLSCSTDAW